MKSKAPAVIGVSVRIVNGREFRVTEYAKQAVKHSNQMPTPYRVIGSTASQATRAGLPAIPAPAIRRQSSGTEAYRRASKALGA